MKSNREQSVSLHDVTQPRPQAQKWNKLLHFFMTLVGHKKLTFQATSQSFAAFCSKT